MAVENFPDCLKISTFTKIPFIVHGFGTRKLNEEKLKEKPALNAFELVTLKQIHSDIVRHAGNRLNRDCKGDALLTHRLGILLCVRTADCLPVLFADVKNKAIGAVHCGWRGTIQGIVRKTVLQMQDLFGTQPDSLLVALGPCIGPSCYEIGEDVYERFKGNKRGEESFYPHPHKEGKYFFDLRKANLIQLFDVGIERKNVFSIDGCTHCEKIFYSYRRGENETGWMLNFIGLSY